MGSYSPGPAAPRGGDNPWAERFGVSFSLPHGELRQLSGEGQAPTTEGLEVRVPLGESGVSLPQICGGILPLKSRRVPRPSAVPGGAEMPQLVP